MLACAGNHRFAGTPVYVQRRELDDACSEDDDTIRERVDAPGVEYVRVAGDTAVFFAELAELDEPRTAGQRLVRALDPAEVWLSHEHEAWRPHDRHGLVLVSRNRAVAASVTALLGGYRGSAVAGLAPQPS